MTRAINMHRHWPRQVLAALLLWLPLLAWAQPRAWLDRDRIAMGDTVTLKSAATAAQEEQLADLADAIANSCKL